MYRAALERIANPIAHMQRRAEAEGLVLNGMMAVAMASDHNYLKGLAKEALAHGAERTFDVAPPDDRYLKAGPLRADCPHNCDRGVIGTDGPGPDETRDYPCPHCDAPGETIRLLRAENAHMRQFITETLTVRDLVQESYGTAKDKGWHDEDDQPPSLAMMRIAAEGLYQAARCQFIEAYRRGERGDDVLRGVDPMGTVATLDAKQVRTIAWLALVSTEVAEAIDDVRHGRWQTTTNEKGKPEGLGSELADVIIRACDTAGAMGIDMEAELRAKLAFNRTRSHRHGGKIA